MSEPYVPVVLEPSTYLMMYWHCEFRQPLPSTPSCAHWAEPQEKAEYVADMAGSNSLLSFCEEHDCAAHGAHSTHETSLPVSMLMTWVTAGVPTLTVITYSAVPRE